MQNAYATLEQCNCSKVSMMEKIGQKSVPLSESMLQLRTWNSDCALQSWPTVIRTWMLSIMLTWYLTVNPYNVQYQSKSGLEMIPILDVQCTRQYVLYPAYDLMIYGDTSVDIFVLHLFVFDNHSVSLKLWRARIGVVFADTKVQWDIFFRALHIKKCLKLST